MYTHVRNKESVDYFVVVGDRIRRKIISMVQKHNIPIVCAWHVTVLWLRTEKKMMGQYEDFYLYCLLSLVLSYHGIYGVLPRCLFDYTLMRSFQRDMFDASETISLYQASLFQNILWSIFLKMFHGQMT